MPLGNWSIEWLNHNTQRSYPLADEASALDTTGTVRIPESLFVAIYFPIHAGLVVESTRFFLRRLTVLPTGLVVQLAYQPVEGAAVPVAVATVPADGHVEYTPYTLRGEGDFSDCVGRLVVGSLAEAASMPAGDYVFAYEATRLDTDTIRPLPRGISRLVVVSADGQASEPIYGDVELVAGTNTRLTTLNQGAGVVRIRIDAVDRRGFAEDCDCEGVGELAPPIRTINGIAPTASGAFTLAGSECLRVEAITNGVALADTCSKPCCGCPELEALTQEVAHFGDEAATLRAFVERLKGQVDQMDSTILTSRLNDAPCLGGC